MIKNTVKQFTRVAEHADEWLVDADLDPRVSYYPPSPEIGAYVLHSESAYARGYRIAADRLVRSVGRKEDDERSLEYPIMFLYRHYIEIQLKQIINLAKHVERDPSKAPFSHNLTELWNGARAKLDTYWPTEDVVHLNRAAEYIAKFAMLDADSQAFRYPRNRKGKVSVGHLRSVNPERLSETMSRLTAFFDFCVHRFYRKIANKDT